MGRRSVGRGAVEEIPITSVGVSLSRTGMRRTVIPPTFRLAGIVLSILEFETVREYGGRFPSAQAKKSQSFSGPPPHFQKFRPLLTPSFWTVRWIAGVLQSQFGWSEFESDIIGGRGRWRGGVGRRAGGGGRGAESVGLLVTNKSCSEGHTIVRRKSDNPSRCWWTSSTPSSTSTSCRVNTSGTMTSTTSSSSSGRPPAIPKTVVIVVAVPTWPWPWPWSRTWTPPPSSPSPATNVPIIAVSTTFDVELDALHQKYVKVSQGQMELQWPTCITFWKSLFARMYTSLY